MVSPDPLSPLRCPRCERSLVFKGKSTFPEGALTGLQELLRDSNSLDVYMCPECGRVEFFVGGVVEEFRRNS